MFGQKSRLQNMQKSKLQGMQNSRPKAPRMFCKDPITKWKHLALYIHTPNHKTYKNQQGLCEPWTVLVLPFDLNVPSTTMDHLSVNNQFFFFFLNQALKILLYQGETGITKSENKKLVQIVDTTLSTANTTKSEQTIICIPQ